jgi:predicted DNA-binding protein (UPF0251 family)
VSYYKPQGVPMSILEIVDLNIEELEALRLRNIKDLDQTKSAEMMNTSQSTFQRILASARVKIAEAIVKGRALKIKE